MAVTVVDPTGSPSPIYNRSGTTVVNMAAGHATSGTPQSFATVIPVSSGHTIAIVTLTNNEQNAVSLPSGEVGDVVEVYLASAVTTLIVVSPSGQSIVPTSTPSLSNGAIFRKVSSAVWHYVGG
jgi:hypothetical protein